MTVNVCKKPGTFTNHCSPKNLAKKASGINENSKIVSSRALHLDTPKSSGTFVENSQSKTKLKQNLSVKKKESEGFLPLITEKHIDYLRKPFKFESLISHDRLSHY